MNTCYWLGTALGDGNKSIKDIIMVYKFLQNSRFYTCNFMGNQCQFFSKCTTSKEEKYRVINMSIMDTRFKLFVKALTTGSECQFS